MLCECENFVTHVLVCVLVCNLGRGCACRDYKSPRMKKGVWNNDTLGRKSICQTFHCQAEPSGLWVFVPGNLCHVCTCGRMWLITCSVCLHLRRYVCLCKYVLLLATLLIAGMFRLFFEMQVIAASRRGERNPAAIPMWLHPCSLRPLGNHHWLCAWVCVYVFVSVRFLMWIACTFDCLF